MILKVKMNKIQHLLTKTIIETRVKLEKLKKGKQ